MKFKKLGVIILSFLILSGIIFSCATRTQSGKIPASTTEIIESNYGGKGIFLDIDFVKGNHHNHPIMAIWIEDEAGNYIQTLFVGQSIGKGIFQHGINTEGKWMPGPVRRPAALPYWGHKRGIKAPEGYYIPTPDEPIPDAYTGATPQGNFLLKTRLDESGVKKFKVLFEINQSWDWNEYWNNDKYPDDIQYKTSSQPAIIYQTLIDIDNTQKEFMMKPIGRSHHSGKDGNLYFDLNTITSALEITESIKVIVR